MLIGYLRTRMPSDAQYIETFEVHAEDDQIVITLKESVPSGGMDGSRNGLWWTEVARTTVENDPSRATNVVAKEIVTVIQNLLRSAAPITKNDGKPTKNFTWLGKTETKGLSVAACAEALKALRA